MSFYRWVVAHPVAVFMLTIAAMVFGLVSYAQLPLNLMPDISYPTLTVRTEFPGAAPEEVESQVSRPIEEALSTVEGLVSIESRSRAGLSDVVLEFDWSIAMHGASQDIRERLQTTPLPDGAARPLVLRYDPSLDPILRVAVSGQGTMLELREFAEKDLKRELETVAGVAAVTVRGGLVRQVRVEPRADWLAARGVTLQQVSAALTEQNVNVAGGIVREGNNEYLIRTLNEFRSTEDVRDLAIVRADGARVPIGELATVSEGAADVEVVARIDGKPAVELEVFKEADANIVTVARAVKADLEKIETKDGVETTVLADQAAFVEAALASLFGDATQGGLLAVLVTFAFLRDWITTLIISTAIPICLVVTFAAMYLGGTSLNLMSLGGLALGVSMVIDSGTVVLENIQNHLDAGLSRQKAAIQGTSEVAAAVFASVLTGMAVFFPIVFVEGVAGQIFGDLALTVVFSLLCSMVVALLFIPMLGARELTLSEPPARARDIPAGLKGLVWKAPRRILAFPLAIGRFALRFLLGLASLVVTVASAWAARLSLGVLLRGLRLFNRATLWMADRFLAGYGVAEARFARVLAWSLERPGAVALGAFSSLILAAVLFSRVGVELIPEVHQGRFTAEIALPAGTPLARTDAVCRQIEDRIRRIDGVETVYSVVGAERRADRKADEGENTARILITLEGGEDLAAREAEAMAKVQRALEGWPGLSSRFTRPALFSFHTPVEVVLYGNELPALKAASNAAVAAMQDVGGLVDVRSSMAGGHPEVQVRYDRARLDALGLGVGQVATAVRDGVQGVTATRLAHGERRVDLLVRLAEVDRDSLEALAAVNVNPRLVPPIRLDSVAELVEGEGPAEIRRVDQRRAAVVSASLTGFDLGGAGEQVARALQHAELGDAEFELAGQSREMSASLESLGWALILAIFLVYVIMASTFESVRDPFVILFSVPLSLVGVAVGLWLTGTPVSVVVFIGLIVLAGVVVANAIVLVDCINLLLRQGRDLDTAIREAAATRLRPILITALNSVIGLVPLALGYGEGAEIQRPLAVTIIFGLGSSTFLTLVVVPVVYRIVNRGRLRATG